MLYGLFAGLCLLPVILSLIGADPYPDAENFQAPPDGHNWYNSELMPRSRIWRIPRPQLVCILQTEVKRDFFPRKVRLLKEGRITQFSIGLDSALCFLTNRNSTDVHSVLLYTFIIYP